MVCMCPKIAWQRTKYPINGNCSKRNLKRLNKISFTYRPGWKQIELPCGECPACKLAKANEWSCRIQNEAEQWHNHGIFVTLTYNNKEIPVIRNGEMKRNNHQNLIDGIITLNKEDMQLYKKRLRKYIKKHNEAMYSWINPNNEKEEKIIRTFECGEYGPKTGRAHYHQIILNWEPKDLKFKEMSEQGYPLYTSKTLQKIWGHGFILIGKISYESASYVARYTMKKQGLAKTKREYYDIEEMDKETGEIVMKTKYRIKKGLIEPEFITMSMGIGKNYFLKHKEEIKKNNGILLNVKGNVQLKKIPRYYKKIWEKLDWQEYEKWKYRYQKHIEQKIKDFINNFKLPENYKIWEKETYINQKILDRQKHKFGLLRRDNITYHQEVNNE